MSSVAGAWNNKGHMTVARITWDQLSADQRDKVLAILKAHPHFDEYLAADRPVNFTEDEWVFLRASTWADWVKNHHQLEFNVPDRHFVDLPYIAEGSTAKPSPLKEENAVSGIERQSKIAKAAGDQASRAVAVTWLMHLVGDVHQPLHAATRYSDEFPDGDRGGNLALVRIPGGGITKLHPMWDGLLGNSTSRSSILGTVKEIESLAANDADSINADLRQHTTAKQWAQECHDLAVKFAYDDGKLKAANADNRPAEQDIPIAGHHYAKNAGTTARLCAFKGGKRLAKLLGEVLAGN
jgi:hypothetical protein